MSLLLHPAADAELTGAVAYYAAIDPTLGQRFYQEMERLIEEIAAHPHLFRLFDPPARRHFSSSFPYGIIYLEKDQTLWIVAVMHFKRQPGYWKNRLD